MIAIALCAPLLMLVVLVLLEWIEAEVVAPSDRVPRVEQPIAHGSPGEIEAAVTDLLRELATRRFSPARRIAAGRRAGEGRKGRPPLRRAS